MDIEINSLESNGTFEVAELPEDKRLVGRKWVYVIKDDDEKCVYKAQYVAKGYSQVQGIDYLETFSPTARMESVRMLIQLAVQNNWPGYEITDKEGKTLVWKLKKSLYGLKQSGRNWHNVLHHHLKELNFVQSNVDPCVFVKSDDSGTTILIVWVMI